MCDRLKMGRRVENVDNVDKMQKIEKTGTVSFYF